jgi:CHAD domain-containing protein
MPTLRRSRNLLAQPAQYLARAVAREYLQRVLEEGARVEGGDPDAVHDLRVALRRLRNWLRLWRPFLRDTVRRSLEQRLRRLSRLAGRARDLEVQCSALTTPGVIRGEPARHGALLVAGVVGVEHTKAVGELRTELLKELAPTAAALDHQLRHYYVEADLDAEEPEALAGPALARLIREQRAALVPKLAALRSGRQLKPAHAARIAVKRLRYLLESLGRSSRNAAAVARRLGLLQHLLGELHDAQLLEARVAALRSRDAAVRALRVRLRARVAAASRVVARERGSRSLRLALRGLERLAESLERARR